MKLRNKDDGRVREFGIDETKSFPYYLRDEFGNTYWAKTIKEIADKWEEIEELKEYWYIDWTPEIGVYHTRDVDSDADKRQREIGNYFETKEEAEKAVEKLKAWKRLKDKGFRFDGWKFTPNCDGTKLADKITIKACMRVNTNDFKDLDLLFGGEE